MSAGRVRVQGPRLGSWEEVDDRLRQIGLLDVKREAIEARLHKAVTALKDASAQDVAPLDVERENLERDVKEFAEAQATEFVHMRSRVLVFGTVGFRRSTKILLKRVEATLKALVAEGMPDCIRTRMEVDKEVLGGYDDEVLRKVGATRKVDDTFFYEIDRERVAMVT